jgi:hypothetical protein
VLAAVDAMPNPKNPPEESEQEIISGEIDADADDERERDPQRRHDTEDESLDIDDEDTEIEEIDLDGLSAMEDGPTS